MKHIRTAPKGTASLGDARQWDWTDGAACVGQDVDLFYGAPGERQEVRALREAKAKGLCRRCPVMLQCREVATQPAPADQHGVQGGMTAEERIAVRRSKIRRKDTLSDRTRADAADALGLARRLQALAVHGHGTARISAETGISRAALSDSRLHRVARPYQRTVDLIREVYPRLLEVPPAPGSPSGTLAARMGWHGADAWPEETIDDPDALPMVHETAA